MKHTPEEILIDKVGKLALSGLKWKSLADRKNQILLAMEEYAKQNNSELLKENEQLKEGIQKEIIVRDELNVALRQANDKLLEEKTTHDKEVGNTAIEYNKRLKVEALNAELLEALKNVIGYISAPYGFDAKRIPNESVKRALELLTKS